MKTILSIKGLHCPSCKTLIEDVASDFKWIQSCTVDLKNGQAVVEYSEPANFEQFKKAVEELGHYTVETIGV